MLWLFSLKLFIHLSVPSSIHGCHHTRKKTMAEINNPPPPRYMCRCLEKACPARGGFIPKILISISATNPIYICRLQSFPITSGCPWPKATVKSPVGARDLRPLRSFISFIFPYLVLFIWPLPCRPALPPALPCPARQTDRRTADFST
jgi:hypothetical protein